MTNVHTKRYDATTRWLHAVLASGVVIQLLLSAVMTVPAGRGLGTRDWHREAFEFHAKVGLFVALVCACHWIWIFLPRARPGYLHLFPWFKQEGRVELWQTLNVRLASQRQSLPSLSPLVGAVHGLGFLAVTGSAVCGLINYLGYFLGAPLPRMLLHGVGMAHIVFGYLILVFLFGHVTMAVLHRAAKRLSSACDTSP